MNDYTNEDGKEVINGYEVTSSVDVGNKRMIFAVNKENAEGERYMQCIMEYDSIFGSYEGFTSDDFFETMKAFADNIKAETIILESERRAIGMKDPSCLTMNDIIQVNSSDDITNQAVAIHEKYLDAPYKDISHQLYYVDSGFGVSPNSRGNACYGWNLYTRKRTRIERYAVIGIVPDEKMPEFAKKTLDDIRSGALKEELPKMKKGDAR